MRAIILILRESQSVGAPSTPILSLLTNNNHYSIDKSILKYYRNKGYIQFPYLNFHVSVSLILSF